MSYLRRGSSESEFPADRLPVHVFPALVGSGRVMLGMALAGVTTLVMLHSRASAEPVFWWLAGVAYLSSVILVVSGIFAINVAETPPARDHRTPSRGPTAQPVEAERPTRSPSPPQTRLVRASPQERQGRLGDLLVEHWHLLTGEQLSQARLEQKRSGQSLLLVLARLGILGDEDLENILSLQLRARDAWHDTPGPG